VRFRLVMTPLVLLINGFTTHDGPRRPMSRSRSRFGLTPERLPMIVTATLAKGAGYLSRKKQESES